MTSEPIPADAPAGERAAVQCRELGGPESLRYETLPRQALRRGTVRLKLATCGVNFPDLLMTRGHYQRRPSLPFIPGMEAAGIVTECSPGVRGLAEGDRVTATAPYGLFASEAVVPATDVRPAPEPFTMTEAATYLIAAHTARHALVDRGRLQPGETVLVLGAGSGIGLAAVELAGLLGARVIAAASTAEKLEAARARGAGVLIACDPKDLVEQVRVAAPEGVDVVVDPVGGELFEQSLRLVAWNGRLLAIGFASGRIGVAPANLPLLRGFSIVGVRAGEAVRRDPDLARRSAREIAQWTADGHLRPLVSSTPRLRDAARALRAMEERRVIGRTALVVDDGRRP